MLKLSPIPAFTDNYIWMIQSSTGSAVAVVDPGEAFPVLQVLKDRDLSLVAVLLTHHHGDHVGGVGELLRENPVPVYGPADDNIPTVDHPLSGGDRVHLVDLNLEFEILDVPGHTLGHIAYVAPGFALVGDTLFAGGCGRVFEGTPQQMYASLQGLTALPGDTLVYCAHEYTIANLRFALAVEPGNASLQRRLEEATAARAENRPTVPSRLADELETNPFLRCDQAGVVATAEAHAGRSLPSGSEVFAAIRGWKDGWRG